MQNHNIDDYLKKKKTKNKVRCAFNPIWLVFFLNTSQTKMLYKFKIKHVFKYAPEELQLKVRNTF